MSFFKQMALDFAQSRKELKNVRTLTGTAFLLALSVVLSLFTWVVNSYMKIGFSTLPIGVIGYLYGPFVSGLAGGLGDILRFIVRPTGQYFPGFTLDSMINGALCGIFLYKRKPSLKNVTLYQVVSLILVSTILHNFWVSVVYGAAWYAILPASIIKNVLKLPIDIALLYGLLKIFHKIAPNDKA